MKKGYIFFLIIILFFGYEKNIKSPHLNKNDLDIYLKNASNLRLGYIIRLSNNKKALLLLKKFENDSSSRSKLIKVAVNFYALNDWINLKKTAEVVYKKSIEKKDKYYLGESYRCFGFYYENLSINDSAFYFFFKAEKIFKELTNEKKICQILVDKALLQYYSNDYFGSELSLIKALKIAKKNKMIESEYDCYIYLQLNSNQLHDYNSAILYGKKSLQLTLEYPSIFKPQDIGFSLNAIGLSYNHLNKFKEAIVYYKYALKDQMHIDTYSTTYSNLLDNFANAQFRLRRNKNVEKIHLLASKIRDSLHIDQGKNYNKLFLSEYYQSVSQTNKALKFASEAYGLSKSYRNPKDMLVCLKQLSKVDPKNALYYSQQYIKISDSMQLVERQTRNKFAKIAYETEEITKEKEAAIKKNWIIAGIAIALIVVILLLFIIKSQRAKQKRLQLQQLQQKESEEVYNLLLDQQSKIDQARAVEKRRIAQDLHDGVMNRLASTRLNLHNTSKSSNSEDIKQWTPLIDRIQDIEKEIREIAHDLNRGAFANKGNLVTIIESFIEEQRRLSKHKYHLEIDKSIKWEVIAGFKKIHIFRIIQEAFQNIHKHAYAKNIIISILRKEDEILLEIFDDGLGFSLNKKKKGIGLQNIFSRAKSCNGIAEIKSKENIGTTIIIKIPI